MRNWMFLRAGTNSKLHLFPIAPEICIKKPGIVLLSAVRTYFYEIYLRANGEDD
jgi:hypothetical protein